MVAIAFLAQNCAIGVSYGVYGTLLEALQEEFQTSRALAASGLSVMSLVMGLLSPVVGSLMERFSIRGLMMVGAAANAVGYGLLAIADSFEVMLVIYALLIGPGVCFLGIIPSSTLVSNWFAKARGKALGIVNTPFTLFVAPVITAVILNRWGIDAVFFSVAALFAVMIPIAALAVSHPSELGQRAYGAAEEEEEKKQADTPPAATASTRAIVTSAPFLVIWLTIGLLTAGGIMMITHIVPMARSMGVGLEAASILLSVYGLSGAVGGLLFGWLADRIGGPAAIATQSLGWVIPWLLLLVVGANVPLLLLLSVLMGLCSGAVVVLLTVIMGQWIGTQNFGRAMGAMYFMKIPFMFVAGPLAGLIFDMTGNYTAAIIMHAATFAVVGLIFLTYRPRKAFQ